MDLHLANSDPTQPAQLTITVVMHPPPDADAGWPDECERVVRELCAYLMARRT